MAGKFNAKSFIVDHGEKVALGFSAAMALYFAAFGGRWSSYTGTPQEIHANVQSGKRALEGHGWPQEEEDLFKLTAQNVPKQIVEENLRQPILAENFPLSTRFVTSPWQGREPLRQPELLALEDTIVDGGKVFIEIPVDPTATEDPAGEGSPTEGDGALAATGKPAEEDTDFGTRGGGVGAANGLPGESPVLPGSLPGTSPVSPSAPGFDPLSSSPYSGDMAGLMGMEGGMGTTAMNRAGQGYLYASVRAVFPLRAQITKYQEATGARTWQAAAQNFDLIDFKLERQEQTNAEQETWSEWAPVDLQAANDVLDQTIGPEPDVVAGSVTNNVITMPLPTRVMGLWKKHASHPRIDNFELTEEEIQQEVELNARMLELARDSRRATDKLMKPKTEKGGFSNRMADSRALQASVFGGDPYGMGMGMGMESPAYGGGSPSGMMTSPMMGMGGHGAPMARPGAVAPGGKRGQPQDRPEVLMAKILSSDDKGEQNKTLAEYIRKTITVSGELLLFRYIDFDVKPGKTYRYRARLVLNNPNFGRNASEADGVTSVVEAETFQTDWSKTTPAVTIERDVHYFVKDVDPQRGRTALTVYQWDTEKGTTINADLDLYPGSYIAGKTKTRVIDAAKMTNEEKADYEFKSKDVFVDSRPDVALLDKNLHKNLKMPGGGRGDALLPEEVLVVQAATGELTLLDPVRQAEDQKKMSDLLGRQNKAYESVGKMDAGMDLMGMEGSYEMMVSPEMGSGSGSRRGSRGRRNPLASGFPGGSSLPGAAGGMPGHGGGGGHGAPAGGKKPPRGSRPNAP